MERGLSPEELHRFKATPRTPTVARQWVKRWWLSMSNTAVKSNNKGRAEPPWSSCLQWSSVRVTSSISIPCPGWNDWNGSRADVSFRKYYSCSATTFSLSVLRNERFETDDQPAQEQSTGSIMELQQFIMSGWTVPIPSQLITRSRWQLSMAHKCNVRDFNSIPNKITTPSETNLYYS